MSQVFGVIAPHPPILLEAVGGDRATVTSRSAAALEEAASLLAAYDPDLVVLVSPHAPSVADAFAIESSARLTGSLADFGAPSAHLEYAGDARFAHALLDRLSQAEIPVVDRASVPTLRSGILDHGVIVPMSFLDPDGRWPLVVLSVSWLDLPTHRELGRLVAQTADDLGVRLAFIASGDCSHRLTPDAPAGFDPQAAEFDRQLVEHIEASRFDELELIDPWLIESAGECGLRSFIALGGATAPARARVLAYEGPWGVGYLTAVVNEHLAATGADSFDSSADRPDAADAPAHHELVKLARTAIEAFVTGQPGLTPVAPVDPSLPARAGTFVSLHRGDDLRGCIGTITPTEPDLAHEVVRNAIQAASADPRFSPVSAEELPLLDIKVDVLHAPEPCTFDDLDPSIYGVIVAHGGRRGLLLPDLPGVTTPAQQVDIARRKAGISADEPYTLERFRVRRYI
jgi:AmmeMemoRadiSam system protein A